MSKKHKHLKSPWDNIQGAVWMIGIAILFFTDNWWPGILFVIAASMIVEAVVQLIVPDVVEEEPAPPLPDRTAPAWEAPQVAAPVAEPPAPVYRIDLLPESCPACGARVRENEVRWVSERSADCAYCASPLMHAR